MRFFLNSIFLKHSVTITSSELCLNMMLDFLEIDDLTIVTDVLVRHLI